MIIRVAGCLVAALLLPHINFPHLGYYPIGKILLNMSSMRDWDPKYDNAYLYIFIGHYVVYVLILLGLSYLLPRRLFGGRNK